MRKIKILLLNPPYKEPIIRDNYCCFTSKSGYLWPPIDLLYLSAILRDKIIELKVIDAIAESKSWQDILVWLDKNKQDIVITLTGTLSYKEDLKGLAKIKNTKIYILGNTPTFLPEFFLNRYKFINGIIHNFYDIKIKEFLVKDNKNCESISYRLKDRIKQGKVNPFNNFSEVSLGKPPQYHLFPLKKYSTPLIKRKPMITVMTSFGCPFHCKFCVASALNYYFRKLEDLEKEFNAIKAIGIKEIFFEDSTFNAYSYYTKKICQLLIKGRYNFSWSANVHSFNLNTELLLLMKKAGCHTVQIGVESGSANILKEYAPTKKINNIKEAFANCRKLGIKTLGYFIIGFPNETKKNAEMTIKFAKQLNPDFASFSILTPDYGTPLREELIRKKQIKDNVGAPFDSSGKAVIKNLKFSKKDQDYYIKKAYRDFYLRPSKLISYLVNYKKFFSYIKNGVYLFFKKKIF